MNPYEGKKVVIIGGTSGIGLSTAKMLIDGGARVLVTGRSQAGLDSTQQKLGQNGIAASSDARSLTDIDALNCACIGSFNAQLPAASPACRCQE